MSAEHPVPEKEEAQVAVKNQDGEPNNDTNVDSGNASGACSGAKSNGSRKRGKRRGRRKKKSNDANGVQPNPSDTKDDNNNTVTTTANLAPNANNGVNGNANVSKKTSKNGGKPTKPNAVKSSDGTTICLKRRTNGTNPSRAGYSNILKKNGARNTQLQLDAIMNEEASQKAQKNSLNAMNGNVDNIEAFMTEEELLQAILLESMRMQPQSEDALAVTSEASNQNVKKVGNVENGSDSGHNADKPDKPHVADAVADAVAEGAENESKAKDEADAKEKKDVGTIDSDYLIAMSLQQKEETQYLQQKQWQERTGGGKYAKVQSVGHVSKPSLNFYYEKQVSEDIGENGGKTEKAEVSKDKINEIDEKLYAWNGGHVDTSGSQLRHDKKTWSKKHISRMNDYDGIGSQLDSNVMIGNQAYNSFCKSVERKGYKREYM